MAIPIVDGNVINWPDDGWYQVQSNDGATTYCNGGSSCEVEPGTYLVINHTTGIRYHDIEVDGNGGSGPDSISVEGNTISWPDDGWYQVQSNDGATTYCNGGSSCEVDPGTYLVINHTTGMRYHDIEVDGNGGGGNPDSIVVEGSVISWPDDGWYQVQSNDGAITYCNGGSSCEVDPGTYLVVNHSTGARYNDIIVPDDSDPEGNTDIDFAGELSFSDTQVYDLSAFIEEAGLNRAGDYVISRDGSTVRGAVYDEFGQINSFLLVNTETEEISWLVTEIGAGTEILFDAANRPIAAVGLRCSPASYTPAFDQTLLDIGSVLSDERCVQQFDAIDVSSDGNVVLFHSYAEGGDPYMERQLNAYTLDTASLQTLPDISVTVAGTTLNPRDPLPYGSESILSDDGQYLFAKQWWEGTDDNGGTLRQVGAVLWNTSTNQWQTRGLAADMRGCVLTDRVNCAPPHYYAMSADGETQYFSIPGSTNLSPEGYPVVFEQTVEVAETGSPDSVVVGQTGGNVQSLITNDDGDLLLLLSTQFNEVVPQGYALYRRSTDTYVSLNRALRSCPLEDDEGNPVEESGCPFTSIPGAITHDPVSFTADGRHILFRAISRFTDDFDQSVGDFFLDVDAATMYVLPDEYGFSSNWINAEASVFVGSSGFPDYQLMIGVR